MGWIHGDENAPCWGAPSCSCPAMDEETVARLRKAAHDEESRWEAYKASHGEFSFQEVMEKLRTSNVCPACGVEGDWCPDGYGWDNCTESHFNPKGETSLILDGASPFSIREMFRSEWDK